MSIEWGIDVVVNPQKAAAGAGAVESALKRIEQQGLRTNRAIATGLTQQRRDLGEVRKAVDATREATKKTGTDSKAAMQSFTDGARSVLNPLRSMVEIINGGGEALRNLHRVASGALNAFATLIDGAREKTRGLNDEIKLFVSSVDRARGLRADMVGDLDTAGREDQSRAIRLARARISALKESNTLKEAGAAMDRAEIQHLRNVVSAEEDAAVTEDARGAAELSRLHLLERSIMTRRALEEAAAEDAKRKAEEGRRDAEARRTAIIGTVSGLDRQFAALRAIEKAQKDVAGAVSLRLISEEKAVEILERQRDLLWGDLHPAHKAIQEESAKALENNLAMLESMGGGRLPDAANPIEKAAEKSKDKPSGALASYLEDLRNVQNTMEVGLVNAAYELKSALVRAFTTGDQSASDFLRSLAAIGVQMGLRGLIGSAIPGKQTGGSFMVGGPAGVDKTPVMFMASRGEQVTVDTPGRAAQGGGSGGGSSMPPVIHNYVISDPREIVAALDTPAGSRVFGNWVRQHPDLIKRHLR